MALHVNKWIKAYIKAWNAKVRPIFLTISSTILGFIPFMVGEYKEAFWFPPAAGTIGGLIVSFMALFFFLPMVMGVAINLTSDFFCIFANKCKTL
jgi:multidrug efflux pump subunit AcrB